ncbi:MAG TPA: tetratricopeptide repeat protein, partial [Chitinophagaceae bacterium]
MDKNLNRILVFFLLLTTTATVHAQVSGLPYELKKPRKFENRRLASEKTGEKKFTVPRKFMQSMITHYNFYFNANEKIKMVLARAKDGHKDDYTKLLSFYNYSLEETARFKGDLDSVIYKSTAGILLHDLRNAWIDNLYLLIGRAYFLRNKLDSAYATFQYVNFAFAPKESDGYDKLIGSNSNEGAFAVSTSEKENIAKKLLSDPPSRNDALVWQVKTYLAGDEMPEAAGLIQTLKHDQLFPPRLRTDLNEVQALYFYKQGMYDSAALYLQRALPNAANSQERARWEYLIAQLYERTGNRAAAEMFYTKAQKRTVDPILEVYALLNAIRQEGGNEDKSIQNAIDGLVKMAHRDKYVDYRDIIYYTAATMESDRKNIAGAKSFLGKSIKYSTNNPRQKSKSFLALADISFAQKDFVSAKRFYDSVETSTIDPDALAAFKARKQTLTDITRQQEIIDRQDSLQRLAAMPLAEREAYVKKLSRQLRRAQGLKEEDVSFGNTNPAIGGFNNNSGPTDLFSNSSASTDWYFTNDALKSKGYTDFKTRWGSRPNVDNWQRSAAVQNQMPGNRAGIDGSTTTNLPIGMAEPLSYASLMKNIPVAPEKLKISNDSVMNAEFAQGRALQDGLEDYLSAIDVYEKLLQRFPGTPLEEQTLFNLYYCYRQTGNQPKMDEIKTRMSQHFATGKLTARVNNPEASTDSLHKKSSEQSYDQIYNLFIEGKFDEALARKHDADSLYGNHYWTPQLLYIEAVYHIQQRDDSTAIKSLNHIVSLYPGSPMADRAKKLVEVLGRRRQIEDYLTNLKIERSPEDSTAVTIANAPTRQQVGTPLRQDSATVGTVKPAVT